MSFEFVDQGRPSYGPPAPVQIIQEEADFAPLLDLYRQRQPRTVLEVGTYAGGTFFHWLQNAPAGALVVSVDLYEEVDNSHLYDGWAAPDVRWRAIEGDSRDPKVVNSAREHGPYEWVFLDAGHLDHEVRADWANYWPMAAPGGIFAFHDIVDHPELPTIQVAPLWAEIKQQYDTAEFASPDTSGIGVVFVPDWIAAYGDMVERDAGSGEA